MSNIDKVNTNSIFKILTNNMLLLKIVLLTLWILFCSYILYIFFRQKSNWNISSEDENLSFTDFLYFSTVTSFTVGYGDISPKTNLLKYIVMFKIYISYIIVSL
jgi:hypothetical protein